MRLPLCLVLLASCGTTFRASQVYYDDVGGGATGEIAFRRMASISESWTVRPLVGVSLFEPLSHVEPGLHVAGIAYAGVRVERQLGRPADVLSISLAPGYYHNSPDGPPLGGALELRLAVELEHRVSKRWAWSVGWVHVSNAGVHDENPGVDGLGVGLTFTP